MNEHCLTCGDAAAELEVVAVDPGAQLARCRDEHGAETAVEIMLVGDVACGERLLVHAGTAIAKVAR
jgi:hydrogenase maturation factor